MSEVAQEAAAPQEGDEATVTVEQPEIDIPSFEADTSGIEDILDGEDDVYEDTTPEPVSYQVDEDEFEDQAVRELKQRLAKTQAQLEHEKNLRVQNSLKSWREEASRRFPLADVEEIEASSRRSVLRKAKEQHERYERKLGPVLEKIDSIRDQVIKEAREEAREQAAQEWGGLGAGPSGATVTASDVEARLDRRKHRSVYEMAKARFESDPRFVNGV